MYIETVAYRYHCLCNGVNTAPNIDICHGVSLSRSSAFKIADADNRKTCVRGHGRRNVKRFDCQQPIRAMSLLTSVTTLAIFVTLVTNQGWGKLRPIRIRIRIREYSANSNFENDGKFAEFEFQHRNSNSLWRIRIRIESCFQNSRIFAENSNSNYDSA
jgi:hypothetical protein